MADVGAGINPSASTLPFDLITRRHSFRALLLGIALASVASATRVQAEGLGLRLETRPRPLPVDTRTPLPVHLAGDRIQALGDDEIDVTGRAEVRKGELRLLAGQVRYFPGVDEIEATGSVRLIAPGGEVSGPRLRLRLSDEIGIIEQPTYQLAPRVRRNPQALIAPAVGRGNAHAIRLEGPDRYRIDEGTFTTCSPGNDDWYLRADSIDLDYIGNSGEARGATLSFMGLSTPRVPWLSFPITDQRKSGVLPPTFGVQGKVGAELTIPYYINLAPDYDDTISTRITARRGNQYINDFRYLERNASGITSFEILPHDPTFDGRRFALHSANVFNWQGGNGGLLVDKVSDDNYFRELSTSLPTATQQNLSRSVFASQALTPGWTVFGRLERFQTLQDPTSQVRVDRQYERMPQLTLAGLQAAPGGTEFGFNGEFVRFGKIGAPVGERLIMNPSIALPLTAPGMFFIPKLQLHASQYRLGDLSASSDPAIQAATTTQSRTLPIASLDTGLVFERPFEWQGRAFANTLEPRLYYVNIPYRNQEGIPLFDTGLRDFNYSTMFSEYYYAGSDRISNANQLTMAVSSRLIRDDNGQEVLRGIIGERVYFQPQRVVLNSPLSPSPSTPRSERLSALLLGLGGQVLPRITVESTGQFVNLSEIERLNLGARYQPELGKLINLGYRYTRADLNPTPDPVSGSTLYETLRQFDLSGQWPLLGRYYMVGRINYSIPDRRSTESVFGFEYNGDCWILRVVSQAFVTGASQSTRVLFLQLELNGMSRLGSNPLEVLKRSVTGYTPLNTPNIDQRQPNLYGD